MDWQEVRVTFVSEHEDEVTHEFPKEVGGVTLPASFEDESASMVFMPGETFYAEIQRFDHMGEPYVKMHVLDTEMPLEFYEVPAKCVKIVPVEYYRAEVEFLSPFALEGGSVVEEGTEVEAGVVDDGSDRVDLLLHVWTEPVNQIKQVPRSILSISRLPV